MKPLVYLLCGLGGSGKSTFADKLVVEGFRKLSLDEQIYSQYGRGIVELPAPEYLQRYRTTQGELDKKLVRLLKKNQSAVLDYGFWRRASRDRYKQLITEHGGDWRLIYLKASPQVLRRRLKARNKRSDANAFPVTEEMLRSFIERFEEPNGEGEEIILQV